MVSKCTCRLQTCKCKDASKVGDSSSSHKLVVTLLCFMPRTCAAKVSAHVHATSHNSQYRCLLLRADAVDVPPWEAVFLAIASFFLWFFPSRCSIYVYSHQWHTQAAIHRQSNTGLLSCSPQLCQWHHSRSLRQLHWCTAVQHHLLHRISTIHDHKHQRSNSLQMITLNESTVSSLCSITKKN